MRNTPEALRQERDARAEVGGQRRRIDEPLEGQLRMEARDDGARLEPLAASVTTPVARPLRVTISATPASVRISTPRSSQARAIACGDRAHAADRVAPRALAPVRLAEAVMQQHVGGARGVGARVGSDDAVEAEDRLDRIALEPVVEQVARRAGEDSRRSRWPSIPSGRSGSPTRAVARARRGSPRGRVRSRRSAAFRARGRAGRRPCARAAPRRRRAARRRAPRISRPPPGCARARPSESGRRAGAGNWTAGARRSSGRGAGGRGRG